MTAGGMNSRTFATLHLESFEGMAFEEAWNPLGGPALTAVRIGSPAPFPYSEGVAAGPAIVRGCSS